MSDDELPDYDEVAAGTNFGYTNASISAHAFAIVRSIRLAY